MQKLYQVPKLQTRNFKSIQQVQREANRVIQSILGDKTNDNPERFNNLLRRYQQQQARLDAQLSSHIKSHIDNINMAKQYIKETNDSMKRSKDKSDQISKTYRRQARFHQVFPSIQRLFNYYKNIGTVIDQLGHFVNLDNELAKIKSLMEDQGSIQAVCQRILNLTHLRDNVIKKIQSERSDKDIQTIKNEFQEIQKLETTFYETVLNTFRNVIKTAKSNPQYLESVVSVVNKIDAALVDKGKNPTFKTRALKTIEDSIDSKFQRQLQDLKSIVQIIQSAKFVPLDLVEILDNVTKCFPSNYNIFEVFQQRYQYNLEKIIMPHFEQIAEQKQYGNILVLMSWIEDYENVLSRAGVSSISYQELKSRAKMLMPMFIDHNQSLVADYIHNCLQEDSKNYNETYFQGLVQSQSEFISNYPSDIFRFINQQAELIRGQVRGEIFIEFVRCIATELSSFQEEIRKEIEAQWTALEASDNFDEVIAYQYKVILHMNNFNECLKHASDSKRQFIEGASEDQQDRVTKIFLNFVQKQFNSSIPVFAGIVTQIMLVDSRREILPFIFGERWEQNEPLVQTMLNGLNQCIQDVDKLISNPVNTILLTKNSYNCFMELYVEQFIYVVKATFGLSGRAWNPKRLKIQKMDRIYNKSNTSRKVLTKSVLSQNIQRDLEVVMRCCENVSMHLNKNQATKIQNKLLTFKQLFSKPKNDFDTVVVKLVKQFPDQCINLIEAVLCIREQLDKSIAFKVEELKANSNKPAATSK